MAPVRILPLLAFAAICLFALKAAGLLFSNGYVLSGSAPASAQATKPDAAAADTPKAAQETPKEAATPDAEPEKAASAGAETGSQPGTAAGDTAQAGVPADSEAAGAVTPTDAAVGKKPVGAEVAVLESLAARRKTLDQRARELELRENLLKAAEKRVEARISELKAIEQRIEGELKKRDDARDEEYAKLVTMYSKMKPKKAAKIFNRLDIDVLTALVRRMQARTASPIFGAMDPAVAELVTMRIANQGEKKRSGAAALPKISSDNPG